MVTFIDFLGTHPLYAVGGALLLLLILYALMKKLFNLALIALLLTLIYLYYVHNLAHQVESATGSAGALVDKAEKFLHQ